MPVSRLCLLGLLALMAGSLAVAAPVPKQRKKPSLLQGHWEMVSREIEGGIAEIPRRVSWTITDNRLLETINGNPFEYAIALNERLDPITLDLTHAKINRSLAIVKLEGEELVVCLVPRNLPRPKKFDMAQGILMRFKRCTLEE